MSTKLVVFFSFLALFVFCLTRIPTSTNPGWPIVAAFFAFYAVLTPRLPNKPRPVPQEDRQ